MYHFFKVTHENKTFSDHCPLTIVFNNVCLEDRDIKCKIFRFEEAWTKDSECEKLVKSAWVQGENALENIKKVKDIFLSTDLFNIKQTRSMLNELEC